MRIAPTVLLIAGLVQAAMAETPEKIAGKYLAAFRAEDAEKLERLAGVPDLNPFAVADVLLAEHLRTPGDTTILDAASDLAERVRKRPDSAGLAKLVAGWRSLDPEQRAEESRCRERLGRIWDALQAGDPAKAVELSEGISSLTDDSASTLTLGHLFFTRAHGLAGTGRGAEAAAAYREAARQAARTGYMRLWAYGLEQSGLAAGRAGQHATAVEAWTELLQGQERAGDPGAAATLVNLGETYRARGDLALAKASYERGLARAEKIGHSLWASNALAGLGLTEWALGQRDRALTCLSRAVEAKRSIGDEAGAAQVLEETGGLHHGAGEGEMALDCYRRALAIREAAEDVRGAVAGILRIEEVLNDLGRSREALVLLRKAREMSLRASLGLDAARCGGEMAYTLHQLGEHEEALEASRQALEEYEALEHPLGIAWMRGMMAGQLKELGRFEEARPLYEKTIADWRRLGRLRDALDGLSDLGRIYLELEEHALAQRAWEEEIAGRIEVEDTRGRAEAHEYLAGLFIDHLGRPRRGLVECRRAISAWIEVGDAAEVIRIRVVVGGWLRQAGEYARALDELERALASPSITPAVAAQAHERHGLVCWRLGLTRQARERLEAAHRLQVALEDQDGIARTLMQIGLTFFQEEDYEGALGRYRGALAIQEAIPQPVEAAQIRVNIGAVYSRLGELDRALDCYETARTALAKRGEGYHALINIGSVHMDRGAPEAARPVLLRALEEAEASSDARAIRAALHNLGRCHRSLGRYAESLEFTHRLLGLRVLEGRGLTDWDRPSVARQRHETCAEGLLTVLAWREAEPGRWHLLEEEAFRLAEAARGEALLEGLVNRDALLEARAPAEIVEQAASARARIEARHAALVSLVSEAPTGSPALLEARRALDAAYADLEEVEGRLGRAVRKLAGLIRPSPVGLAEAREWLDARTALVLYRFTEERLLALTVTRETTELHDLGDVGAWRRDVEAYVALAGMPGSAEASKAAALYDALVRPMESDLDGADRLIIAPDGILAFLPFEALVRTEGSARRRLLGRHEVVLVPSVTVLLSLEGGEESAEGILAVGDPAYPGEREGTIACRDAVLRGFGSLDRLKASGDEVRAVAELFPEDRRTLLLRAEATKDRLRSELARGGRRAAVHLACHGLVDAERPRLTGLVLSGGETLTLDDVYRMSVPADLVVLSACETGRGKLLRGEGVMGLVRGFFLAGSPRVVVSNWKVSDESARRLMVSFYTKMREGGLAPAAALRAAKLEMLRAGGETAHPAHWAAFVLWGLSE